MNLRTVVGHGRNIAMGPMAWYLKPMFNAHMCFMWYTCVPVLCAITDVMTFIPDSFMYIPAMGYVPNISRNDI